MSDTTTEAGRAGNKVKSTASAVRDAMDSAGSQISEKAANVAETVKNAGVNAAAYARDQYDHLSEHARDVAGRARDVAGQWQGQAEQIVRRTPLRSVLIAAGIGVAIGMLMNHHRRD